MSSKCPASVLQVSASVSQVSHKSLTSVPQVPRKCLASVSQVSRKCQTSRECIGETSIVYAHISRVPLSSACTWDRFGPRQEPLNSSDACESASATCELIDTRRPMAYLMQYVRSFRLFLSQKTVQRCRSRTGAMSTHYVSVLSITQRRLHLGILRTTHHVSAYYVSSAESPPEKAMYYALRIRIMYQEPKAAGEGYLLRITYPH